MLNSNDEGELLELDYQAILKKCREVQDEYEKPTHKLSGNLGALEGEYAILGISLQFPD